ncbi:MAG TPA: InlB B-repeat-containing protein, partial [Spirochaetota bacterium]|nr:InlB B-repeat-containing protein [Spirochaetota bacterium]
MRYFYITLVFLFVFSCSNPFAHLSKDSEEKKTEEKKVTFGTVKVAFSTSDENENISRSVVADIESQITGWVVTLEKDGKNLSSDATGNSATFNEVEAGVWRATVEGKNASGKLVAWGENSVTVNENETSECSVSVRAKTTADGKGKFSLTILFPTDTEIDCIQGTLLKYEDQTSVLSFNIIPEAVASSTNLKALFSGEEVASGLYHLVFTFLRGGATGKSAGTFREAINIWDNVVSDKWLGADGTLLTQRTFAKTDFFDNNASLSNLTLTNVLSGSYSFSSSNGTYDNVLATSDSFGFTPIKGIDGQKIEYSTDGGAYAPTSSGAQTILTLDSYAHVISIKVTAPDRATVKAYTINITRVYKVIYDGNGSSGGTPPDIAYYKANETVTIAGNTGSLTKTGKRFMGWNLQSDALGRDYDVGNTSLVMGTSDITLYARWGITYEEAKTM